MFRSRLLVLLSAVCFGTTGTAQALGAAGASPVTVGEARIVLGAIGLHLAARWVARSRGGSPSSVALLPHSLRLWSAAAAVAGYQVTFFLAVRSTGVAVGTVVALGSAPVLTGALGWALGHGRPDRRWAAATALAAAGLAVLTLHGGTARVSTAGVLLAMGAGASYAVYTLAVKRALGSGAAPEATMAALFAGGALLLAPALVLLPIGWLASGRGALAVAWLGLVPTAVAYVLFARGLRGLSAAEASTLTLAEPLTAALLGVLLLSESPSASTVAGAALLLLGLAVLGVSRRPAAGAVSDGVDGAASEGVEPGPASEGPASGGVASEGVESG
ncbi:MAG TPA: EamA family transporter, partial [Kineosporiaceae bacterium]|nr:EamA family transporter [Kineosporiaceae bacterium]